MTTAQTTGTVRSGDVEIFYRRFGRPGRIPVLIVHGLSYFSYDWIGPASTLAIDREVVTIDIRGFGQSGWSPSRDYKLETLSADVINLLDAFGWPQAVLVGHSFGGRVVLATAGWKPERAGALVLVDFAPDIAAAGRRHTAERIGRQPDVFVSVDEALAYHGHEGVPAQSPLRTRYEAFLKPVAGGFQLRRDLSFRDNFKKALDTGQSAPVPAFLWPMLSGLKIPTLVIRGAQSDMLDAPTLEKARQANSRITAIELPGSHDLAGDNPEALVSAIQSFLTQAKV